LRQLRRRAGSSCRSARLLVSSTAVVGALFVGGLAGCGGGGGTAPEGGTVPLKQLSTLGADATVGSVEERFGPPAAKPTEGDETVMHYPGWAVTFEGGEFREATSERRPRGTPRLGARAGGRFDRRVLTLPPPTPVSKLEKKLGPPDVIEVSYYDAKPIRKIFRYGAWELEIKGNKLARRQER
jgi:hypothetical protein